MNEELIIELVWNRTFDWSFYKRTKKGLIHAIKLAESIRDSGDGARVKKVRVVDAETEEVLWRG